jgi:hypothetical protein
MKKNIVSRMPLFTALAGLVFALAGFAYAGAVSVQGSQKAKKGSLNITVATDVGGVTLEPGNYEVKQVNSAMGPVVRFTRVTYNPYAPEGVSVYQWDVVAQVKCTVEPLASAPQRTELLLATKGEKTIGLQIRGNGVEYLF